MEFSHGCRHLVQDSVEGRDLGVQVCRQDHHLPRDIRDQQRPEDDPDEAEQVLTFRGGGNLKLDQQTDGRVESVEILMLRPGEVASSRLPAILGLNQQVPGASQEVQIEQQVEDDLE